MIVNNQALKLYLLYILLIAPLMFIHFEHLNI